MRRMTKAELEEENRNMRTRLERIAFLLSDENFNAFLDKKKAEGFDFDSCLSVANAYIIGSARVFSSPNKDGVYDRIY